MTESNVRLNLDHITDDHLQGIGSVTVAWSFLEGAIERMIWELAELSTNRGICITSHMSMNMRLDSMCALANHKYPDSDIATKLNELSNNIRSELSGKRNEVVHSRVVSPAGMDILVRPIYKARGKIKRDAKEASVEEYQQIVNEILEAASEIWNLKSRILNE